MSLGKGGNGEVIVSPENKKEAVKVQEFVLIEESSSIRYWGQTAINEAGICATFKSCTHRANVEGNSVRISMGLGVTDLWFLFNKKEEEVPKNLEPWFVDILRGVVDLHARGFMHLDLKPNNVLVMPDGSLQIIDFGSARPLNTIEHKAYTTFSSVPPEAVCSKKHTPSPLNDAWAVGTIFMWMLIGPERFDHNVRRPSRPKRVNGKLWEVAASLRAEKVDERSSVQDAYARLKAPNDPDYPLRLPVFLDPPRAVKTQHFVKEIAKMLPPSTSTTGTGLVLALAVNLFARLDGKTSRPHEELQACVHIASIVNLPDQFQEGLFLEKENDPIFLAVQRVLNALDFKIMNTTCANLIVDDGHTDICVTTLANILEKTPCAEEAYREYVGRKRQRRGEAVKTL
jgi:hypothetical protein